MYAIRSYYVQRSRLINAWRPAVDIKKFKSDNGCDRLVAVWCGSTEVYRKPTDVHSSLAKFEEGLRNSDAESYNFV